MYSYAICKIHVPCRTPEFTYVQYMYMYMYIFMSPPVLSCCLFELILGIQIKPERSHHCSVCKR